MNNQIHLSGVSLHGSLIDRFIKLETNPNTPESTWNKSISQAIDYSVTITRDVSSPYRYFVECDLPNVDHNLEYWHIDKITQELAKIELYSNSMAGGAYQYAQKRKEILNACDSMTKIFTDAQRGVK
jgi:hypothetical protein